MNDAYWLGKYLEDGSEAAFRSLVQKHLDLVYAAAHRCLNNPALAQEATQSVFILLARKAPALRGRTDLAGWLYKAALLKAREILREECRREQREAQAVCLGTTMNEDQSLLKALACVLDDAMLDLREKDRQALLLRYLEDKSLRDVGLALGVGEDAAQKRVAAALESLTRAFRKRGYAATGVGIAAATLREAVQAAPAGLLTVVSHTAVTQAAGGSVLGLSLLLAKLMTLTKTQTAALCLLLAAGPVAWQWHALKQVRASQQGFLETLRAAETNLAQLQSEHRRLQRRLDGSRNASAQFLASLSRRQNSASRTAEADAALYRWSEKSEFIRVPKRVLFRITLAEEPQTPPQNRSWEDTPRPVLSKDGTISTAVVEALDLSANQVDELRTTLGGFSRQFDIAAQQYSMLTNAAPENLGFFTASGHGEQKTLYTAAFPDEGAALEAQLRDSLDSLLGPERTGIFWQQAQHDFNYLFNHFGKSPKAVTVVRLSPSPPQFCIRTQVRGENMEQFESRFSFFCASQVPGWAGYQHRVLPAEFQNWWPDPNQSPAPDSHE